MQNNARELAEYPATRNRTRDHLIAAEVYSQMLYQLSYSRRWRSTVFQAIAPQACFQGFTLDVIYIYIYICMCVCVCVCVCPGHCFAEQGNPGINKTRLCCSRASFRGGGPETKHPRVICFWPLLPKGKHLRRGQDLKNKHPHHLSGPMLRGGGWRKQKPAQHLSGHRWRREGEP